MPCNVADLQHVSQSGPSIQCSDSSWNANKPRQNTLGLCCNFSSLPLLAVLFTVTNHLSLLIGVTEYLLPFQQQLRNNSFTNSPLFFNSLATQYQSQLLLSIRPCNAAKEMNLSFSWPTS